MGLLSLLMGRGREAGNPAPLEDAALAAAPAGPAYRSGRADALSRAVAHSFGLAAERWVSLRLRLQGYTVLAHRFRSSAGEIDLIARRGGRLAFVEVKARRTLEDPRSLVSATSVRRIRTAADDFLRRYPRLSSCEQSFDLAVVDGLSVTIHRGVL